MKTLKVLLIVICLVITGCDTSIKNEPVKEVIYPTPIIYSSSPIIQTPVSPTILPTNSLLAIQTPILSFTPTPIYTPTPNCDNIICTIKMYIFDDEGQFVNDAIIRGEILIEECKKKYFMVNDVNFLSGKSKNGQALINVPVAIPIKYIVSKEGYKTKEFIHIKINNTPECIPDDIYFGCPASNLNLPYLVHCSDGVPPLSRSIYGGSKYALSRIK